MTQRSILETKGQNLSLLQEKFQSCLLEEEDLSWMVMKSRKHLALNNVDVYSDKQLGFLSDGYF